jgi:ComF family protein
LLAQSDAVVRSVTRVVLDMILPPRCLSCGEPVAGVRQLCAPCWSRAEFVSDPMCARCGLPLDYDVGSDAVCGACAQKAPVYQRARAALRYEGTGRSLILALKHGDRTDAAPALASWMARAGRDVLADCDLIVPVPLHRRRLFDRRFNQSAMLAAALGRIGGKPCLPGALIRARPTPPQKGLSRAARFRNLAGAIGLRNGVGQTLTGRRILLIDDVMTTGATAESCTRALLRGGCAGVDVLTVARVVRQDAGAI